MFSSGRLTAEKLSFKSNMLVSCITTDGYYKQLQNIFFFFWETYTYFVVLGIVISINGHSQVYVYKLKTRTKCRG